MMTEQEIERCLERLSTCKAADIMNFDYAGTLAYIQSLKSENAALRARIDKFDDLHIHMGEAIYIITDNNEIIERFICGIHILSTEIIFVTAITANYKPCDKKGVAAQGWHCIKNNLGLIPLRYFGERAFTDRAAAEARLNEMKGEKE